MPRIKLKSKEFKSALKVFSQFSARNYRNTNATITFDFKPFRMITDTDHALVFTNLDLVECDGNQIPYSFNPEVLLKLAFTSPEIELNWDNNRYRGCLWRELDQNPIKGLDYFKEFKR